MKKKKNRITGILSLLVLSGIIASLLVYGWKAGAVRQAAEEDSEEDEGDTASDLEEPYVLAYLELLKEYAGDDNDVENERARFALAFIDDDEVPELKSVLPEAIDDLVLKRATACFTYEELPDGTLRITGYDEEKNTQNPYQVMIPSMIGGKQVSTLGKECLGMPYAGNLLELTVPDGITTIEENVI